MLLCQIVRLMLIIFKYKEGQLLIECGNELILILALLTLLRYFVTMLI